MAWAQAQADGGAMPTPPDHAGPPAPAWRRLWAAHGIRMLTFGAVGATAALVNWLGFLGLQGWGVEPHVASAAATEVSILWGFAVHSLVTFRGLDPALRRSGRFVAFHAVALVGLGVTVLAFTAWHDLAGVPGTWAQLLALPIAAPGNYLGQRYVTWRATRPSA